MKSDLAQWAKHGLVQSFLLWHYYDIREITPRNSLLEPYPKAMFLCQMEYIIRTDMVCHLVSNKEDVVPHLVLDHLTQRWGHACAKFLTWTNYRAFVSHKVSKPYPGQGFEPHKVGLFAHCMAWLRIWHSEYFSPREHCSGNNIRKKFKTIFLSQFMEIFKFLKMIFRSRKGIWDEKGIISMRFENKHI